jgi:adenosine deaminase
MPPVQLDRALLRRLPKADLHLHLDGSLRPETMLELADRQGVALPAQTPDDLRRHLLQSPDRCGSLQEFLKAFDLTVSVLQEADALSRTAYELLQDCAEENCRYLEVRFAPILHRRRGLALEAIMEAVLDGLARGERDFGVRAGAIVCGLRTMSPETSLRLAELAVLYWNRGVVGFDLAGAELDHPPKRHLQAFYLIRNHNVNCTIHAGESYGPASIHQALHYCGAHRIGHGVRLAEDPALMAYVNDHRIALECCLTSNVQTHAVPSYEAHPLRKFYEAGLRVTVNADSRLICGTTATGELELCVERLGFDAWGVRTLILNGFKSAFLHFSERRGLERKTLVELDDLLGIDERGLVKDSLREALA